METVDPIVNRVVPSLENLHSTSESPTSSSNECAKCQDSGWLEANGRLRRCPCWIERCIKAAIPRRFHTSRIIDFSRTTGDMIVAWIRNPTDGLFLIGPAGTGKTHMAAAIVRLLIEAGQPAKFARAADFYSALRATYSEEGSEQAVLHGYLRPQFLILDDVGAGSMSDHERRFTLELLDKRLNERRPTIVTSNWKIDEIGDRMDVRIASRLSGFTTLDFGGKDRRVKSA